MQLAKNSPWTVYLLIELNIRVDCFPVRQTKDVDVRDFDVLINWRISSIDFSGRTNWCFRFCAYVDAIDKSHL